MAVEANVEDVEAFDGDLMAMAIPPCWLWTVICAATKKGKYK